MPLNSHVSTDVFLHIPPSLNRDQLISSQFPAGDGGSSFSSGEGRKNPVQQHRKRQRRKVTVLFFIPGNPGLIGYYHPFLSLLVQGMNDRKREVVVAGFSLGGFDVDVESQIGGKNEVTSHEEESRKCEMKNLLYPLLYSSPHPQPRGGPSGHAEGKTDEANDDSSSNQGKLYTLREQIDLSYARVKNLLRRLWKEQCSIGLEEEQDGEPFKVILMGHSVGTYIALELVRLWHERHSDPPALHTSPPLASPYLQTGSNIWIISCCVLLAPTLVDIHLSPSGRLATPLLTSIPLLSASLPRLAHALLHSALVKALPSHWFTWLIRKVTGMQPGTHGFEITVAFLHSKRGVKQALFMAGMEMMEIRADRWGDEIWGASTTIEASDADRFRERGARSPSLYLLFARRDHWIAEATREEIIQKRGRGPVEGVDSVKARAGTESVPPRQRNIEKGRPTTPTIRMAVMDGLVHAWCLAQNEIVAQQVRGWLEEVLGQDS
ncbi:uncharacterized protein Z518_01123 [Rhinocladiella mackenziei CBS 650.93]|uniref:Lipid droplet-associated hydrolase n=1 Tax=Rhinocladiella mackenziei CBS 650.93 TaxID=1442369 RepID=A0A0D2G5G2_9EURO|nr:uncharacterized protein Z518_01123 [Rhinocladiella mackenziei CBS 650.93]KIX10042.1 hypothetical protein Z518_01123 [Rhinocladiella mackenziei CBS 650.93]